MALRSGAASVRLLRFGLIAPASYGRPGQPRTQGSNHGTGFATSCNGFDETRRAVFTGTFVAGERRMPNVEITRLWDPLRTAAENLAAVGRIPIVCARAEDCAEDVDAVVIADDGSGEQWRHATQLDELQVATVTGSNDFVYDGIHGLSIAYAVWGRGAVSCVNVGQPGRHLARVRYRDGHDVMLIVADRDVVRVGDQITLYGSKGWKTVTPIWRIGMHTRSRRFSILSAPGRSACPSKRKLR